MNGSSGVSLFLFGYLYLIVYWSALRIFSVLVSFFDLCIACQIQALVQV